ncbi:hypothetical protein OZD68_03670 [Wolbachia endosymbiont of Drosophila bicornuta]|nr:MULTISPECIES: hypothetical protein [Wolbachia]MBA8755024.1 hypothetical protein [Wolbachia pipientis]MDE5056674.1 hypothetical protein [Wolbachia endosymbiont of Drosophila bicornuta]
MLLLYHSHKHISYPIRTIARSAINVNAQIHMANGIPAFKATRTTLQI